MSLPFTEWISGAFSRSERSRSSSAAPWQPAPHMITTLAGPVDQARDFGDIALVGGDLRARLQRRDAGDPPWALAPITSCGSVRWATPRPA